MDDRQKPKSAMSVSKGVKQPPVVNPHLQKHKKKSLSIGEYIDGIRAGDRTILSMAITLVESSLPGHTDVSQAIIEKCLPYSGNSVRIGITGVPGVGKSTFIENLGKLVTLSGSKLAVLAVDPSSERSRGSILGDKTRMEQLASDEKAFIRPSPSAGSLGGVARKTRESILLCEAAGYDVIFVETVGVGQSETAVHSMVDVFLLLMLAGAGDELQGIKRGIMEMADILAITKADGDNTDKAAQAAAQFRSALHLFPESPSGWTPQVLTCSALNNEGMDSLWEKIMEFKAFTIGNNYFTERRRTQALFWMDETLNELVMANFFRDGRIREKLEQLRDDVLHNRISSFRAAHIILDEYLKSMKQRQK